MPLVSHWTIKNTSGMHHVAEDMAKGEQALGLASLCLDPTVADDVEKGRDAPVHVVHTALPDGIDRDAAKTVCVLHGMPEQTFQNSFWTGQDHGASDGWHSVMYYLTKCDEAVTFWPRHKFIWDSMLDKGRSVGLVTMPIDTSFWHPVESRGRYLGKPSVLMAENSQTEKWAYDLLVAWPTIMKELPAAWFHLFGLPYNQHRWFFSLLARNGALYRSFVTPNRYGHDEVRNALNSVDFYWNPGAYGDFNRMTLEAQACGCKVISYRGNEYADYWVDEGDQRVIAQQLLLIFKGVIPPREEKLPVPDPAASARAMIAIYERLLGTAIAPPAAVPEGPSVTGGAPREADDGPPKDPGPPARKTTKRKRK